VDDVTDEIVDNMTEEIDNIGDVADEADNTDTDETDNTGDVTDEVWTVKNSTAIKGYST